MDMSMLQHLFKSSEGATVLACGPQSHREGDSQ